MSKSIFLFLFLGVAAACGHTSGTETEDGLLRVYPQLVPGSSEQTAAPVARAEAVAKAAPVELQPVAAAPVESVDETPSSLAVRVKGAKRCRVRVGDERLGRAPFRARPVAPGTHRVVVKCARGRTFSDVIEFHPGEPQQLVLTRADLRKSRRVARK